jgi:flavin-dependent thymidylate synthase
VAQPTYEQERDVSFNRHSLNDGSHTSPDVLHSGTVHVGSKGIDVRLIQGINEAHFKQVCRIATQATTGVDPDAPDETLWDEMLKGGLQTALETQTVCFLVSGISRALTHQLVRTRKASFHQQSQRATFMGTNFNVRIPQSIMDDEWVLGQYVRAIQMARYAYEAACDHDIAYQDARYIMPEGSETQILCEYPLREFLNMYAYRACTMFLWEHVAVVREMGRLLVLAHPWLEPYVKISCEKVRRCTFQGWENTEDQCDFPWSADRVYVPAEELRIERKTQRVSQDDSTSTDK